jgi:hypothetical protein
MESVPGAVATGVKIHGLSAKGAKYHSLGQRPR